jgi:hypothetical protein
VNRSSDGTPAAPGKSISDVFRSARDFFDRNYHVPAVVRIRPRLADYRKGQTIPAAYDEPKELFVPGQFTRWFARLLEDFGHLWPELENQIANLIAIACDGVQYSASWRAPGWLAYWNSEPPMGVDLTERLSVNATKKVIAELRRYAKRYLSQIHHPVKRPRRIMHLNRIKVQIAMVKRDFPKVKATEQICALLDRREVPIPAPWKKAGKNSWDETWKDPSFRDKVKPYISKVPPLAKS